MRDREPLIALVRQWVQKAENDLVMAAHALTLGDQCPGDSVCFHAQQCVEKYLKAFLLSESIDFPKTHDIEHLITLSRGRLTVSISPEQQRWLTQHATVLRYPGDYPPTILREARKAVALARRTRREVRRLLPKRALRRKSN